MVIGYIMSDEQKQFISLLLSHNLNDLEIFLLTHPNFDLNEQIHPKNSETLFFHIVRYFNDLSADEKNYELFDLLFNHTIKPNLNLTAQNERTVLMNTNDVKLIELLIEHGANIEHYDQFGFNKMMHMCQYGIEEVFDLLLKYKANINCYSQISPYLIDDRCFNLVELILSGIEPNMSMIKKLYEAGFNQEVDQEKIAILSEIKNEFDELLATVKEKEQLDNIINLVDNNKYNKIKI